MRDTQQSEAPNSLCPDGKYTNTNYINIKHYNKYKNPICKDDKNKSHPQPIKKVLVAAIPNRLPGVRVNDVTVCTKSSRLALKYVRFKLIKRTKSKSGDS